MEEKLGYAILEIGGIQKFILATGKLKEMIGGSQLVEEMSKTYFEKICAECREPFKIISSENSKCPSSHEILALQCNAGVLHLLFASVKEAKEFISYFGERMIDDYTGVPLFSGVAECSWDKDAFRIARREADRHLNISRSTNSSPSGLNMMALCVQSPLDGFPATTYDRSGDGKKKPISALSKTKGMERLIKSANERLEKLIAGYTTYKVKFEEDLEKMISEKEGDVKSKIAFIHMDGNDLGKMFRKHFEKQEEQKDAITLEEALKSNCILSQTVSESSDAAMKAALIELIKFEAQMRQVKPGEELVIPARPLVLGGDDVTAIVRADLALLFISTFINEFESFSKKKFIEQEREGSLTMGVGMVVCNSHYPFTKAFNISEALLDIAKKKTAHDKDRKSSMDYVVITNEVEKDIEEHLSHVLKAADGSHLSIKPLMLYENKLHDFVKNAVMVLDNLPRSSIRPAINECRKGEIPSKKIWDQILYKLNYEMGGRHDSSRMAPADFKAIFPESFFVKTEDNKKATALGDYIELAHLLPEKEYRKSYIERLVFGVDEK